APLSRGGSGLSSCGRALCAGARLLRLARRSVSCPTTNGRPRWARLRGEGRGQWRGPSRGAKSAFVERREAVIVGSGPAGAATAPRLAALAPELAAGMLPPHKAPHPPGQARARGGIPKA